MESNDPRHTVKMDGTFTVDQSAILFPLDCINGAIKLNSAADIIHNCSDTINTNVANPLLDFTNMDASKLAGEISTNNIFRDTLSAKYSELVAWEESMQLVDSWRLPSYEVEDQSIIFQGAENLDYKTLEINEETSQLEIHKKDIFNESIFANIDEFLEFLSLLRAVFTILSTLYVLELLYSVFILGIFSQQFGGNRDLPVITT